MELFVTLSARLDSAFFAESCGAFFLFFFFFSFVCTRNWRQRLLFIYCAWTVAENFDFSTIFSTSVGPMNSTQNLQILLFSNFFIKNWSHNTIHTFKNYFSKWVFGFKKNIKNGSRSTIYTFKNYFVTVFSVFNKISNIQTDPNIAFLFVALEKDTSPFI